MSDTESFTNEIEESPGIVSSMRVTLRTVRRLGSIMILSGIALSIAVVVLNSRFEIISFATILVATGSGMITGLGAAKAWQSGVESNNATTVDPNDIRRNHNDKRRDHTDIRNQETECGER